MTAPGAEVLEARLLTGGGGDFEPEGDRKVVSKSPTRLAMDRFRKDKLSMISFVVVALYFLAALAAPILVKTDVLDPLAYNQDLLNELTLPTGGWGGVCWEPPPRVDPGTGPAVLSRILLRSPFSLISVIAGTPVALVI